MKPPENNFVMPTARYHRSRYSRLRSNWYESLAVVSDYRPPAWSAASLAAGRQHPVVAKVDALERAEDVVLRFVLLVEVAAVEVEGRLLSERERPHGILGAFSLHSP